MAQDQPSSLPAAPVEVVIQQRQQTNDEDEYHFDGQSNVILTLFFHGKKRKPNRVIKNWSKNKMTIQDQHHTSCNNINKREESIDPVAVPVAFCDELQATTDITEIILSCLLSSKAEEPVAPHKFCKSMPHQRLFHHR